MPPRRAMSPSPPQTAFHHRLELTDKMHDHDKYWEVELQDSTITYRWGRRGTAGQSKTESADDGTLKKAQQALAAKLRSGYRDVSALDAASVGQNLTHKEKATLDNLSDNRLYSCAKASLLPHYASCAVWLWLATALLAPQSTREDAAVAWLVPALCALAFGAMRTTLVNSPETYTEVPALLASVAHGACQALLLASCLTSLPQPAWLSPLPFLAATRAGLLSASNALVITADLEALPPPSLAASVPPSVLLLVVAVAVEVGLLLLGGVPLGLLGSLLDLRLLTLHSSRPAALHMRILWLLAHAFGTALLPALPLSYGDRLLEAIDAACGVALVEREAWIACRVCWCYTAWMSGSVTLRPCRDTWLFHGYLNAHQPRAHRVIDLGRILPSEYEQATTTSTTAVRLEARQRRHDRRLQRALRRWAVHKADNAPVWNLIEMTKRGLASALLPARLRVHVQHSPGGIQLVN